LETVGFGGLLKDVDWIHGYSNSCQRMSNVFIKLLAIWRGLHSAWDLGHRFVILVFDSKTVLDLIIGGHNIYFHLHATIISLAKKLSSLSWMVKFTDTLREGNKCVCWLAKF